MPLMANESATTGRVKVWECIGCGRIEFPQPCIGICQDRKVEFVYASEHDEVLVQARALEALVRRFACTTPRAGEWERSYRAFQDQARRLLATFASDAAAFSHPDDKKEEMAR